MSKIVFFEIEEWEKEYFIKNLQGQDVTFLSEPFEKERTFDENIFQAEILSPFIYSQLTAENLAKFPNLKLIVTRSMGYDHIDLAYCKEKHITVCNVPIYGVHGVAEHAFSLILALTKKLIKSIEQTRRGNFENETLTGTELFGKTLGVIGAGKIGNSVIQIAKGFGMNIVIYSHHTDPEIEKMGAKFVSLDALLADSDIVTIHVPLTDETKHMINMQNIHKFKKGALLINTARGAIVETQAILEGLEKGILSGVGVDVLEEECNLREERELLSKEFAKVCDLKTQLMDHMLIDRDDVIVTPHNAFNTKESLEHILATTVEDIASFIAGKAINTL